MNTSYLMKRAVQIVQTQPDMLLCHDRYCASEMVTERLITLGYEVKTLDRYTTSPSYPEEPKAEDFSNPERYGEAHTRHE